MVEGHQCHRVAHAHRKLLLGKAFKATSPNNRFREGAAAIDGKPLTRIEVHGKNLFYLFGPCPPQLLTRAQAYAAAAAAAAGAAAGAAAATAARRKAGPSAAAAVAAATAAAAAALTTTTATATATAAAAAAPAAGGGVAGSSSGAAAAAAGAGKEEEGPVVLHIHFGMSGAFRTSPLPGPEPTETTRLRLVHEASGLVAHLSAMTVQHGGLDLYYEKMMKLGPDPLREDAAPEELWGRLAGCRKPVGLVLMDQSLMAGVGNIYRAEILFKAGVHPEQQAASIDRATFDAIWGHSVALLQRGFVSGSILTVDPEEAKVLGKPWTRRYVYNHRQCGRCKGPIRSWDMASRTVYACEACQPLRLQQGGQLEPQRAKQLAAAVPAKEFVSHCAPDDPADVTPAKMTCAQLRAQLTALNLSTRGNKAQLVERLEAARGWMQQQQPAPAPAAAGGTESSSPAAAAAAGAAKEGAVATPAAGAAAAPAAPRARGKAGRAAAPQRQQLPFERDDAEAAAVAAAADGSDDDGDLGSGDEVDRAEELLEHQLAVSPLLLPPSAPAAGAGSRAAGEGTGTAAAEAAAAAAAAAMPLPEPGTAALLDQVATARQAAEEKLAAGESRAVEHVALADEDTDRLAAAGDRAGNRKRARSEAQQQLPKRRRAGQKR